MSADKLFISRASTDTDISEQIARILEAAGYEVTVQQRDFASRNFIERMDDALIGGARVVALLSPDYLKSDYCRAEWMNAIANDPLNKQQRLVVLRVSPCEPQGLLAGIVYHDLVPVRDDPARFAAAVLGAISAARDAAAHSTRATAAPVAPTAPAAAPVAPAAVPAAAPAAAPSAAKPRLPVGAVAGLGLLAVVLIAVGFKAFSGAAPPAPQPTTETRSAAAPADADAIMRAVRSYYADWNDRRFDAMWATLSPAFHRDHPRPKWIHDHSFDKAIRVESLQAVDRDTVVAKVVAIDETPSGGVQESTYRVTWRLAFQNGSWLLDSYVQ